MVANTIAAHIEGAILELFWWHVARGVDRLELLRLLSAQPVTRSAEWRTDAVREQATQALASWYQHASITLPADQCFSCGTGDRKLYWHHVIQIQHGGSNHPKNRVPICYRCHASIHPWLPRNRKGEQRTGEWWSLADVLDEAERRETPLGDITAGSRVTSEEPGR